MEKFEHIVLNIPHAAVLHGVFSPEYGGWEPDARFINENVLDHADWYTDLMFEDRSNPRIQAVVAEFSRFVVDMERLDDDPLEAEGQGKVYTHYGYGRRSGLTPEMRAKLEQLWLDYQHRLLAAVQARPNSLLIDCHSFCAREAEDIDVCLGYNDDWSRPSDATLRRITEVFEEQGYRVGINTPYSNAKTPLAERLGDGGYKSFMIELNKCTYMHEREHTINDAPRYAPRMHQAILTLYERLLEEKSSGNDYHHRGLCQDER
jgi:N-formylglutamate amidohydrolase